MYIAKHKITGKIFNDYKNSSGALISYIKEVSPEIEIPSKFLRNSYYMKNKKYWYEQYFDIIEYDDIKGKKGEGLSDETLSEIVRMYKEKEINSIHKLAIKFNVAHKTISNILKNSGCEINKIGGVSIYDNNLKNKYIEDDEYTYRAIHKNSGLVFEDYNNISGILTKYILKEHPSFKVPKLESEKKRFFLENKKYWYEEFFDIIKFKRSDLNLKKCPYCDAYIDISISNIKYKNHLIREHSINIIEHVNYNPSDIDMFRVEIDKITRFKNNDNWVECKICGKKIWYY